MDEASGYSKGGSVMNRIFKLILFSTLIISLSGCDTGFQQMGPTEYGVKFRMLPPTLGGGIAKKVVRPGEMAIIWPWDSIYRFDTSVKDVTWGAPSGKTDVPEGNYVYTRAADGNEVALAVTVRYRVAAEPEKLRELARTVATSNSQIEDIVVAIARSDIRTSMNELKTSEFLEKEARYRGVDKAKSLIDSRLNTYGIEIERVNLDDFRFERLLKDGKIDASYQEKLKEIQKTREETEREISRIDTVTAKKNQEYNTAQAEVNRVVQEAEGYKQQAMVRGDAYLQAKGNGAKAIKALGEAEVEGLTKQIKALSGPGGKALLKLELVKQLLKYDPKFIVVGEGASSEGIQVQRLDTNDLIGQIGILEGLEKSKAKEQIAPDTKLEEQVKEDF